jgi:hypothetical protein
MHFCHEELFMLLAAIPGLAFLVRRLRAWWHRHHTCQHKEP